MVGVYSLVLIWERLFMPDLRASLPLTSVHTRDGYRASRGRAISEHVNWSIPTLMESPQANICGHLKWKELSREAHRRV